MTEVAAASPWTDMFELEKNQASGRAEARLGGSSLTLTPLAADSVSVRRSQPIFIPSNRWGGSLQAAAVLKTLKESVDDPKMCRS